jgi:DNA repair protein RadD
MITLRPYQQAAITEIFSWWEKRPGNALIVLPTGTGKSLVVADTCRRCLEWPGTRILVLTHVRELIRQNAEELLRLWPEAPIGINSAGLGKRDYRSQIVFCGIQSVHDHATRFGKVDIVLVDEAHLIPRTSNTMYRKFLRELEVINPYLKVVGLTATPYRLDSGRLDEGEGAIFDGIAYEYGMRRAVEEGYLSPLVSKATETKLDVTGVATRGGEFVAGDLERAVDVDAINRAVVNETIALGQDRKAWLFFCAGVKHAEHIRDLVREQGYTCENIFGDTPKVERDRIVADFKAGRIRALASMGVLTTGFNVPAVDLIALARPTKSPGLYVQICGRGSRLAAGKTNCLILDFARNIERHGPVDLINPKKPRRGEEGGEAPVKTCPSCECFVPISARECVECGYEFPKPEPKIDRSASTLAVMSTGKPQAVRVSAISYHEHRKVTDPNAPPTLRVDYRCGLVTHREWVALEHKGYARQKAVSWWISRRGSLPAPASVADALRRTNELAAVEEIQLRMAGRHAEILGARIVRSVPPGAEGLRIYSGPR